MEHQVRRVEPEDAWDELRELKEQGYNVLVDMTALDLSPQAKTPRFEVIYRVMSLEPTTGLEARPRVEVRCAVGEDPVLKSAAGLWPAADWLEREVWDMFGIRFADRPRMRRLLLYEEFQGHPLRKDYPIAKRQPLIGPPSGEPADNPSFNAVKPTVSYE